MKRSYHREHVKEAHCHATQMTAQTDIKKRVTRFRILGLSKSDLKFRDRKKKSCVLLHSPSRHIQTLFHLPNCFYYFYIILNFVR